MKVHCTKKGHGFLSEQSISIDLVLQNDVCDLHFGPTEETIKVAYSVQRTVFIRHYEK